MLLAIALTLLPQDPPLDPAVLQRQFDALPQARQELLLQRLDSRLEQQDAVLLVRARTLAAAASTPGPLPARSFHDPGEFAPVAPRRRLLPPTDPRHRSTAKDFRPVDFIRDDAPTVSYDWWSGQVTLAPDPVPASARFAALLAGHPPRGDLAVAHLQHELDVDADQRDLAHWFGHLYADRDGRVFAGISLYDAWYAGRIVEVPDVDAIAFARRIVQTDAHVSPIPDGRRRDRLYAQIRAAFSHHREYRTLREAAAIAAIAAVPSVDPTYEALIPRLFLLWEACGHDPAAMQKQLAADDRSGLIERLDRALREDPDAFAIVEARRRLGQQTLALLRSAAAAELAAMR